MLPKEKEKTLIYYKRYYFLALLLNASSFFFFGILHKVITLGNRRIIQLIFKDEFSQDAFSNDSRMM